jgi:glutathione S-transferase
MSAPILFHAAPSRSSVVRWMLEEIGEPYDLHVLKLAQGDQRKPDFLAINPQGKVPALKHGDVVVTEVAAICAYLADAFPRAGLAVPIGDPRRGTYLQWLFFGPSCVEPAMMDRSFPRNPAPPPTAIGYRDLDALLDVIGTAVSRGPYLMGEQFTAADVVIGAGLRWGMLFKMIPERADLVAYVGRIAARPALQRADALDKELAAA